MRARDEPPRAPSVGGRAGHGARARATSSCSRRRGLEIGGARRRARGPATRAWATCFERPRLRERYLVVVAGGAAGGPRADRGDPRRRALAALSDAEVREDGPGASASSEVASQRLSSCGRRSARSTPTGRAARRDPRAHPRRARRDDLGAHAGLALEGVALYVSEDRRVGEAAAHRGARSQRRGRAADARAASREPDAIARSAATRQAAAYAYARRRRSTSSSASAASAFCASTTPSTTRSCAAGRRRAADRAVRRALGVSLARLERDLRDWISHRGPASLELGDARAARGRDDPPPPGAPRRGPPARAPGDPRRALVAAAGARRAVRRRRGPRASSGSAAAASTSCSSSRTRST